MKLFKKCKCKSRLIHINYGDWSKNEKGLLFTVGTVRDDKGQVLLQYNYIPTGYGAVVQFPDISYFISKIKDLSIIDGFITSDYGALHNGHSITQLINAYIN